MKAITLFSDGSSLGNPGPGGWGTILEYKGVIKKFQGGDKYTTNNRMELLGVIKGLEQLKESCDVKIVSDSTYVVKGINEWLINWQKKDFKNVKNPELWKRYLDVSKPHKIKAQWVRGHDGHPQNEECDTMARQEAEKYKKLF